VNDFYQAIKTEIEFWRELIDQTDLKQSSPEYQRMQQALQLAKNKLLNFELSLVDSANGPFAH